MIRPKSIKRMAMISWSPSTMKVAEPEAKAVTSALVLCTRAVVVTQSMIASGGNQPSCAAAGDLHEYAQGHQDQGR